MLGEKPHEAGAARRQMLAGVPVDRGSLRDTPTLVIGAGLDRNDHSCRLGRAGWMARRGVRTVRRALALRPGRRRDELPAGRRRDPGVPGDQPTVTGRMRAGRGGSTARSPRRIRLEAQDTALSRRRSPVRIRYAVPESPVSARSTLGSGFFFVRRRTPGTLISTLIRIGRCLVIGRCVAERATTRRRGSRDDDDSARSRGERPRTASSRAIASVCIVGRAWL